MLTFVIQKLKVYVKFAKATITTYTIVDIRCLRLLFKFARLAFIYRILLYILLKKVQ